MSCRGNPHPAADRLVSSGLRLTRGNIELLPLVDDVKCYFISSGDAALFLNFFLFFKDDDVLFDLIIENYNGRYAMPKNNNKKARQT